MNNPNNNFFDIINLASLIIGMQNLQENREQSAHNDVQTENQRQTQFLMTEINRQFEEQNIMLRQIIEMIKDMRSDKDG